MQIGKIDLKEPFSLLNSHPNRNDILLQTGIFGIIMIVLSLLTTLAPSVAIEALASDVSKAIYSTIYLVYNLLVTLISFLLSSPLLGQQFLSFQNWSRDKNSVFDLLFNNLGHKTVLGIKLSIVYFVYSLPTLLFTTLGAIGDSGFFSTEIVENDNFPILPLITTCLTVLYTLFFGFILRPAVIKVAADNNNPLAGLRIITVISVAFSNLGKIFNYTIVSILLSLALAFLFIMAGISVFLCVGLVLLPIMLAISIAYQAYIEPAYMAEAFKK